MNENQKNYEPSLIEGRLYQFWEESGFFRADPESQRPPYCIILPPPNVTGALHMGHALVDTLQDILIRWKRMLGYEALWVPGTDHAGIATQAVVERHLYTTTGKRKGDYSREEFISQIWNWKEKCEGQILSQLKKLGCSLDWNFLRFTMDKESSQAVLAMFKKLYDEGYIYQGNRLVNWDYALKTAISDDEVEHEQRDSYLWFIRYPLTSGKGSITVATTRPETMLGDTAVAVNPNDERYAHLIGKTISLPFTQREIPIIADSYVDPAFGTGAVKITPAHDFNDYEMGLRHNLPMINIMNIDGSINEHGGEFAGLSMEKGRELIVLKLKELSLLERVEPHANRVGISYRSKVVIEPYLSKQWFIAMEPFKEKILSAVRDQRVKIVPEHWDKVYYHWIENLKDWCISRQLWWGHRIPIWHHVSDPERKICYVGEGLPVEVQKNPDEWKQDEDVLDTWFSSALWPMSTLGWPNDTPSLQKFYPTSVLVTGHDILFFWVARMIFMGEYALGDVPFRESFIHGLIYGKSYWRENASTGITYVSLKERASYERGEPVPSDVQFKWEKMSKSKGNVIDPIEIIEEFGADSLRMTLCHSTTHARQIDLDLRRFEEYKNFANKIWNASRFIFMNLDTPATFSSEHMAEGLNLSQLTLDDKWILSRLQDTIRSTHQRLEAYEFSEVAKGLYEFFWDEFCAYYLEMCKPYLFAKQGTQVEKSNKQKLLVYILLSFTRLLHPIMPYITEELFLLLKQRFSPLSSPPPRIDPYMNDLLHALSHTACIISPYPTPLLTPSQEEVEQFKLLQEIVHAIRNIRAEMQVPLASPIEVYLASSEPSIGDLLRANTSIFHSLIKIKKIHFSHPDLSSASLAIVHGVTILVPLPSELRDKEFSRLTKELEKQKSLIESLQSKLQNSSFIERAPIELVTKTKTTLQDAEKLASEISSKLTSLQN